MSVIYKRVCFRLIYDNKKISLLLLSLPFLSYSRLALRIMSVSRIIEVATVVLQDRNETTNVEESKPRHRWLRTYFSKWTGQHITAPLSSVTISDYIVAFFGTCIGVGILSAINYHLLAKYVGKLVFSFN